ncbi:discoidin domain-containing protein [Actinoplanes sp. Pm04-4]|uniref:Discoidin domain-containing protein n=1 Tax=Paractinoplanes pyxinae TaxID=2997416 RepID=A0ABT4B0C3_9ACTN|nr:discoidin domain-containing protein [Actinoplanes pyxinae]MCY1139941.1 discoidin domain-containing protein [Actinoplanes pyxinae]
MPPVRPRTRPAEASPPPGSPPPPSPPPARRKSRKAWWVAAGAVVTLAAAGGLMVAYRATTDATIPDRGVPPVAIPTETVAGADPAPAVSSGASRPVAVAPVASASRVPSRSPSVRTSPPITSRANPSRANLALTSTLTASSSEGPPWPPGDAADGDPESRWSSGFAEPQWLRADLGSRRVVSEVTLVWEHAYAIAYRVDVSLDGRKWRTVFSTTAGAGGTVRVDTGGTTARYVRMYGTKRSNQYGFSLYELEIR